MSIHEVSVRCAAYLAGEIGGDSRQETRMAYGLEILLGEIIKMTCLVLLSWYFGILLEVLSITITAGVLRLASGGEHCSGYYRCLIGGTVCFLLLGWGTHYLNVFFTPPHAYIGIVLSLLVSWGVLWKYAPGETENKPINSEEERLKFRKVSLFLLLIYGLVMMTFTNYIKLQPLVLPIMIGMIEQSFTVSPWGYHFIHFVDRALIFEKAEL